MLETEVDVFTKLIPLLNVGGMGFFAFLVYRELQGWRKDSKETVEGFIAAIVDSNEKLAILLDRTKDNG
tara:strand:- start:928 stop:1134 length:207 start_codon:yes stop_codon:yes gene_type:complete